MRALLILAGLALPCLAAAQTVTHVRANGWMSSNFFDPANPGCSIGSDGSLPGSRMIMGASMRRPAPVSLVVRRTGWTLPAVPMRVRAEFPDGTTMTLIGQGHGPSIDIDLGADLLPGWIHMLTSSAVMRLAFDGNEPPWIFDLTGTTRVVNAMGDCLRDHAIAGVPPPFAMTNVAQAAPQGIQSAPQIAAAPSFAEALSQMGRPPPSMPSPPAQPPGASLPGCAAIASAQERLSCYDRARPDAPAPAAPAFERPVPAYVSPVPTQQAGTQDGFLAVLRRAEDAYAAAANEMQAGGVRAARARELCQALPGGRMVDWSGTISSLSSSGSGAGVLEITLAPNVAVGTSNNALSDAGDNTLIKPGSPLFEQVASLAEGRRVRFSGFLLPGDDDCFRNVRLTQRGAMTTPKFIARFDAIAPD